MIKLDMRYAGGSLSEESLEAQRTRVEEAHRLLHSGQGAGSDFLGWLTLPESYDREEFVRIQAAAERIQRESDLLIVVGIGGSYLGARAAIELLRSPFYNSLKKDTPDIYFAGNSLCAAQLSDILSICEGKRVSVNVISKSGTTTEPALAFRVIMDYMHSRYGSDAKKRVYCTTDKASGSLRRLADENGYESFSIPADIGGRYSVLTAVGLLPMAVAGINIDEVLRGATAAMHEFDFPDISKNQCYRYAAARRLLGDQGRNIELFVSYQPSFAMMGEWLKQLFGESEGKEKKGLFPAYVGFSTDLHSMGQFVQEGSPILFETVIDIENGQRDITVPTGDEGDGLGFLTGRSLSEINRKAMIGTLLAHNEGGVPNLILKLACIDCFHFGYMVYFFEKACAIGGYLLSVNPFDQPGVENYKRNMFALLGKPGYEELGETLLDKLGL